METKQILEEKIYPYIDMWEVAEFANLSPRGKSSCECPSCGQRRAYINTKGDVPFIICNRKESCGYVGNPWSVLSQCTDLSKGDILKKLAEIANLNLDALSNEKIDNQEKMKEIYENLSIENSFKELEPSKKGNSYQCKCPSCNGRAFIPIKNGDIIPKIYCSDNCGYKKTFFEYVQDREKLDSKDTFKFLEEASNYRPLLNPNKKIEKRVVYDENINYLEFNSSKKFNVVDIKEFLPKYAGLEKHQQVKIVYTYLYNFALSTNQTPKYGYYLNKRGIEKGHKALEKIAYLSVKDFNKVSSLLKSTFPEDDLVEFGIFKYVEKHDDNLFSLYSIDKGGILLVPSFDLFSNTVTAFQARPTHPPHWMIEKKIKELQVSCVDIVKPLPFGMGYKMLKDVDSCIFATEGHPDALAIPTNVKECNSTYFMAIPGVNGIAGNQEVLGLLKGRIVYICFDQDKAGQDGAEKFAKMLQAAGAIPIIKLWDQKLGDDINNLRINGNIGKVF